LKIFETPWYAKKVF